MNTKRQAGTNKEPTKLDSRIRNHGVESVVVAMVVVADEPWRGLLRWLRAETRSRAFLQCPFKIIYADLVPLTCTCTLRSYVYHDYVLVELTSIHDTSHHRAQAHELAVKHQARAFPLYKMALGSSIEMMSS